MNKSIYWKNAAFPDNVVDLRSVGSEGIIVPSGSSAERSGTPVPGTIRYNTDVDRFETYTTQGWTNVGNAGYLAPVTFTAGLDVSNSSFTVTYGDKTYSANPASIPFLTTGFFNNTQWIRPLFIEEAENIVARVDLGVLDASVLTTTQNAEQTTIDRGIVTTLTNQAGVYSASALASDIDATAQASVATSAKNAAIAARNVAIASSAQAQLSANEANAVRDTIYRNNGVYLTTAHGIGRGVRAVTIVSGGTGGPAGPVTATWVASGGTAVIPATGTATILGGVIIAVAVDQPGEYSADPTGITLTGAGGLTGENLVLTIGVNTPVGGHFSVPVTGSDTATILYKVDAGPVATYVTTYASSTVINRELVGQIVGNTTTATGLIGLNESFYYWPDTLKSYDQLLSQIEVAVNAARYIQIVVSRVEIDGSLSLVKMHYAEAAIGTNTFVTNIFVPAGCVVGLGKMGAFYYTATTGTPVWKTAAAPTTSTTKTIGTTTNIHHKLTLIGTTMAHAKLGSDIAPVVDNEIGTTVVGLPPIASGLTAVNSTCYFWPDSVRAYEQALTLVEVAVAVARTASILVAQIEVDGSLSLVSSTPITLAIGENSVITQVVVPAGCIVGMGNLGTYYYSVASPICWSTAAIPTVSTAKTAITVSVANIRMSLSANTKAKAEIGYSLANTMADVVGSIVSPGWPSLVATGSTASNYTIILQTAAPGDGRITRLQIAANAGGSVRVFAATIGAGPIATITAYQDVTVSSGINDILVSVPITEGQYAGVYVVGTVGIKFQNSVNPQGVSYWYQTSLPAGSAVIQTSQHRFELALTIKTGLQAAATMSMPSGTGLNYFESADKTGVVDATALFSAARGAHPAPYVPPGDYSVTSLPGSGNGFWGPGRPFLNGTRIFLPPEPSSTTLLSAIRSSLARHIAAGDVITLIGDSISHFAYAATGASHWFNRFTSYMNLGIASDEPIMTALRPSSTYTPAFYGVTVSGGTTGTSGPIGESLILADGNYFEFVGAYEQVDVFAKEISGAGTLSIAYDTIVYASKSYASGTTALDVHSGFPATGQITSGTYRVTAVGGPVEITGLIRMGVNQSTTATAPRRVRTMRAAHGSYKFSNFNPTAVKSILKQASYAGGKAVPIIALGINDSFGTTVPTILSNATAVLDELAAGGVTRMFAVLPIRPSSAWNVTYTGGRTFDAVIGPLRALYESRGITILPVDAIDWVGAGLLSDGLHPSDQGNDRMATVVINAMAVMGVETDPAIIDTATRKLKIAAGMPVVAERIVDTAGTISPTMYRNQTPITIGVTYEHVIIAAAAENRYMNLFSNAYINWDITFDLVNGTFVTAGGTGSMKYIGGGMYECIASGTANTTGTCTPQIRPSPNGIRPYLGNINNGLVIESMEFRVAGTTTNLHGAHTRPSDDYFTKTNITTASIVTNPESLATEVKATAVVAETVSDVVNGTNTLWAMTESVAGSGKNTRMYQTMPAIVSGSSYKVRIHGKAGTRGRIGLYSNSALLASVSINLATGIAIDHGAATVRSTRYLLNGTWECDITIIAAASGSANLQIWTLDGVSVPGSARVSDGVSQAFIHSVNVYKDGGQNILLGPSDFASASWIKDVSMTLTPNAGTYLGVFDQTSPMVAAHPLSGKKVAFVGTSLVVQGLMTAAFTTETGAIVQALGYSGGSLGLDARGVPHYGSGQVTALLPSIAVDTEVIIIDMLVNDVAAADVPLGTVTDTTTATYRGALANAFAWCEANRPGAAVAVVVQTAASATYPTSDYRHGVANANGNFLSDFQTATRQMCDQYGRAFIDPNRFGIGFLDSGDDTSDGLHWDASGASRIGKIYAKSTRELCEAGWLD